jgi:hypothetical protein
MVPARILLALAATLLVAAPSFGQDSGQPAFHPFVFGVASGDSTSETTVYDLRMPIAFTVISPRDGRWGLRIRLTTYAGIYRFDLDDAIDLDLRFESLAATPGVELLVPVGKGWILKPFAEIGYGRDFDNSLDYGVWSVGVRTIVTWAVKEWDFSLGTKAQYLSTFTSNIAVKDDFGEIRLGFDARHPLPLTIGGNMADISGYYIRRQWVDAFIARDELDPLEIQYSNEIGFTFGATPKVKLWFFKLPRIGVGYRWGPNIKGFRLNFGFPF